MYLSNRLISKVLNLFGWAVLIIGLLSSLYIGATLSSLYGGGAFLIAAMAAVSSVASSFVFIAISRMLNMATEIWTSDRVNS